MFGRKKIKALEEKIEAYKKLVDQYHEALAAREETIRRFYSWESGVKRVSVAYTITDSDINNYNADRIPKVARERMAPVIARRIASSTEPTEILGANGEIIGYEYDLDIRKASGRGTEFTSKDK